MRDEENRWLPYIVLDFLKKAWHNDHIHSKCTVFKIWHNLSATIDEQKPIIRTLHTINTVTIVKLTQHWSVGSRPRGAVIHRGCRTWCRRHRTCLTPGPWPAGCTQPQRGWWREAAERGSGHQTLGEMRRCCQTLESSVRWCCWRSRCPHSELNSTRR